MNLTQRIFGLDIRSIVQFLLTGAVIFTSLSGTSTKPVVAAATTTISGRVYDVASGGGYTGVTLQLCGAGTVTTAPNGNWQTVVPVGTLYCVRISDGGPKDMIGPQTRNNVDVGAQDSYEHQTADKNCYRSSGCNADAQKHDRSTDGGFDFVYAMKPAAASVALPTPASASEVSTPVQFMAKATAEARAIELTWKSGVGSAPTAYVLERSIDEKNWDKLTQGSTALSYRDQAVAPDVRYYYRLVALDTAGKSSAPIITNATFANVLSAQTKPNSEFTSSDNVATAILQADVLPEKSSCTVEKADRWTIGERTMIAGPYELICRLPSGEGITDFKRPVRWKFVLANRLRGFERPQLVRLVDNRPSGIVGGTYDANTTAFTVEAPGTGRVALAASTPSRNWINAVAIGGAVLLVIILVALIPLQARRKQNYQEYLRSKYYNL